MRSSKKGSATNTLIFSGAAILILLALLMYVVPVLQGTSARQLNTLRANAIASTNNTSTIAVELSIYDNSTQQIATQAQNQGSVWTAGNVAAVVIFIGAAAAAGFSIIGAMRKT